MQCNIVNYSHRALPQFPELSHEAIFQRTLIFEAHWIYTERHNLVTLWFFSFSVRSPYSLHLSLVYLYYIQQVGHWTFSRVQKDKWYFLGTNLLCQRREDWGINALLCARIHTSVPEFYLIWFFHPPMGTAITSVRQRKYPRVATVQWGHQPGASWLINGQTRFQKKVWLISSAHGLPTIPHTVLIITDLLRMHQLLDSIHTWS